MVLLARSRRFLAEAVAGLPADGRLELTGSEAGTPWDPELAVMMRHLNVAVHEETVMPALLADLSSTVVG